MGYPKSRPCPSVKCQDSGTQDEKMSHFHKTENHNYHIQYILYGKNSDKYVESPGRAAERLKRNETASRAFRRSCQVSRSRVPLLRAAIDNSSRAAETTVDGHGVHSAVLGLTSAYPACSCFGAAT
jgi:hypothetical protein